MKFAAVVVFFCCIAISPAFAAGWNLVTQYTDSSCTTRDSYRYYWNSVCEAEPSGCVATGHGYYAKSECVAADLDMTTEEPEEGWVKYILYQSSKDCSEPFYVIAGPPGRCIYAGGYFVTVRTNCSQSAETSFHITSDSECANSLIDYPINQMDSCTATTYGVQTFHAHATCNLATLAPTASAPVSAPLAEQINPEAQSAPGSSSIQSKTPVKSGSESLAFGFVTLTFGVIALAF